MIKTGYKDERGYPKSADFFIPSGKYSRYFTEVYGAKPSIIQIMFINDDPEISCNERYEYRDKSGKLFAYGDGESFYVWNENKYDLFLISDYPDLMDRVNSKVDYKGWSVILTLRFVLPKVKSIAGYWEYTTRGNLSTIPQIRNSYDAMLEYRGFVKGILFDLSVSFAKSQRPGDNRKYPVVQLIANQHEDNIRMLKDSIVNPNKKELN